MKNSEKSSSEEDLLTNEQKEQSVWNTLKMVYDPEIPVSIVDLGLVYDVSLENDGKKVNVKLTLTVPGCMMGPTIAEEARDRVLALKGVEEVNVEIVWEPPWHQSMISPEGKKILGIED